MSELSSSTIAMDSIQRISKDGARDVIVAFSARDTERGRFTFWSVLKGVHANVVFVNDYSNGWYLQGTPEFGSHDEFVQALRDRIAAMTGAGGRLFTLGSSMGAYAALRY